MYNDSILTISRYLYNFIIQSKPKLEIVWHMYWVQWSSVCPVKIIILWDHKINTIINFLCDGITYLGMFIAWHQI